VEDNNSKIVLVTGTFNIMHPGHVRLLEFCSDFGKVVVGINSDKYLNSKYGKDKTITLADRVFVLKSCKYVDSVVAFSEDEPTNLIKKIKPDFYVKGPDYKNKVIPEDKILNLMGIKKIIQPNKKEYSSSELIKDVSLNDFTFFNN
tara:strand:+ start:11854 stop:12291 length:438 start_codon:yes stop_codon:yes gene_type:complete